MKIRNALIFALGMSAFSCNSTESDLQAVTNDEGIEISEGVLSVLFYQLKPKSLDGKFERSNYIHPLYSLDGKVMTEDFPEDHPHHHGIFSAWHQIRLGGKAIADGWSGKNLSWNVVDTKVVNGRDRIAVNSEVLWQSVLDGTQPEPIVKENLNITVHSSNHQFRIIDFDFVLFPLKDSLKIGGSENEKGYGGFCVRLKLPDDIRCNTVQGEVEAQVTSIDGGPWMNFVGSFGGKDLPKSGLSVFSHPSNPGNPPRWIIRKAKSMQNAAYPGRYPVELNKEGLKFRYRMIVHNNGLDEKAIEELYEQYAEI